MVVKVLLAVVLFYLLTYSLVAQTTAYGRIGGQVQDETGHPLPMVTVLLQRTSDSTMVRATVSNEQGTFNLTGIPSGAYYMQVTLLGYQPYRSRPITIDERSTHIDFGRIQLAVEPRQVAEVRVVARRPFIEQDAEKTVINVSNSIVSAGGTALDVLEKAPGVEVDQQSGRVSLRGKEGLLILINGKPTNLSAQELASFLQPMSSTNIDRIEIMANPPARFDASGNAGIINIRLKKETGAGFNGTLTLGTGYGETAKYNAAGSFNYRSRDVTIYANADWNHNPLHVSTNFKKLVNHPRGPVVVDQYNDWYMQNASRSANLGFDWTLTRRTTLGSLATWTGLGANQLSINKAYLQSGNRTDSIIAFRGNSNGGSDRYLANLNLKHVFDSTNRQHPPAELTIDVDYSAYSFRRRNSYVGAYTEPDGSILTPLQFRSSAPTRITLISAKADFIRPLTKAAAVEIGYKTTLIQTSSDVLFEQAVGESWQRDNRFNINFRYRERLHAGYLNYRQTGPRWDVQAGIRAEYTHSVGEAIDADSRVERRYLNWFPSVFITRKITSNQQLQLSYSRRIDRPTYQEINPNVDFNTPILFNQGNPFLTPQYMQNWLLTHTYKGVVTAVGYSDATGTVLWVARQNDLTFEQRSTYLNARRFRNINLTTTFPWSPVRGWNSTTSLSLYRNQYDFEHLGGSFHSDQLSVSLRSTHTLTLPRNWLIEVSGFYNSPRAGGFITINQQSAIGLGVQHQFWQKRATVRAAVSDLFYGNTYRNTIRYENLNVTNSARRETRQGRITFAYRFGSQQVKAARKRTTSSEEDQRRL